MKSKFRCPIFLSSTALKPRSHETNDWRVAHTRGHTAPGADNQRCQVSAISASRPLFSTTKNLKDFLAVLILSLYDTIPSIFLRYR